MSETSAETSVETSVETSAETTVETVEPGIYEHFKGQRYEVIGCGKHTETEESLVFYRTLYGDYSFWVRPVAMFTEHVERDGYSGPRFARIA